MYFLIFERLEGLTTIPLSDIAMHISHENEWAICRSDFM